MLNFRNTPRESLIHSIDAVYARIHTNILPLDTPHFLVRAVLGDQVFIKLDEY